MEKVGNHSVTVIKGRPEDTYTFFREVQENESQGTTMLLNN